MAFFALVPKVFEIRQNNKSCMCSGTQSQRLSEIWVLDTLAPLFLPGKYPIPWDLQHKSKFTFLTKELEIWIWFKLDQLELLGGGLET